MDLCRCGLHCLEINYGWLQCADTKQYILLKLTVLFGRSNVWTDTVFTLEINVLAQT
jgi:hypothetical protein